MVFIYIHYLVKEDIYIYNFDIYIWAHRYISTYPQLIYSFVKSIEKKVLTLSNKVINQVRTKIKVENRVNEQIVG